MQESREVDNWCYRHERETEEGECTECIQEKVQKKKDVKKKAVKKKPRGHYDVPYIVALTALRRGRIKGRKLSQRQVLLFKAVVAGKAFP